MRHDVVAALEALIAGVKARYGWSNAVIAQLEREAARQGRAMPELVETVATTVDIMMPEP